MTRITLTTMDGGEKQVPARDIEKLRGEVDGGLTLPGEEGYDEARTIWNAMIDRRPAMAVRCTSPHQVQAAVGFAAAHDALVAIRSGGHNIAGNAVCDGGLLLDLSPMRAVEIDHAARTARVQAGALLCNLDEAAQEHGLAVPLGINSTTGVAGLTLGGGYGWLTRKHGLTIDNLKAAQVVTVDGRLIRASAAEEPDLFWALRGGGGNFGVVTSFEFNLQPVGPEVLSGLIVHPAADAPAMLRRYRELALDMPEDLTVWVVLRKAPPLPFLPEEWHGKEVLVFACCWAGEMAEGERALEPLRSSGTPIADVIGPHPYAGWQKAFDPLLEPGARNYWKSHNFNELCDEFFDLLVEALGRLPTSECEIFIAQLGGAPQKVGVETTAFAHRSANFLMNVHTRWRDVSDDTRCVAWAREIFDRVEPYATGGVYVNFMPADETGRVKGAYGVSHARLAALKAKYDPGNLLRMNMNIRPSE